MDDIVKKRADLIIRYLKGVLSDTDQQELEAWISESPDNRQLFTKLTDPGQLQRTLIRYAGKKRKILKRVQATINYSKSRRRPVFWAGSYKYMAIVAILLVLGIVAWYGLTQFNVDPVEGYLPESNEEAMPLGDEQAKLTLGNGSVIILIDTVNGLLAKDAGGYVQVLKENEWISYQGGGPEDSLYMNTLQVFHGSGYKLVLPDASRVWLGAGSRLRYPVVFGGNTRKVELMGQAYFEVTGLPGTNTLLQQPHYDPAIKSKPFIVNVLTPFGERKQQVTGARFTVNGQGWPMVK
jgi:transmembrane sensor